MTACLGRAKPLSTAQRSRGWHGVGFYPELSALIPRRFKKCLPLCELSDEGAPNHRHHCSNRQWEQLKWKGFRCKQGRQRPARKLNRIKMSFRISVGFGTSAFLWSTLIWHPVKRNKWHRKRVFIVIIFSGYRNNIDVVLVHESFIFVEFGRSLFFFIFKRVIVCGTKLPEILCSYVRLRSTYLNGRPRDTRFSIDINDYQSDNQ